MPVAPTQDAEASFSCRVVLQLDDLVHDRLHLRRKTVLDKPRAFQDLLGSTFRRAGTPVYLFKPLYVLANPLDRLRLLAHCMACDAPLGGDKGETRGGVGDAQTHHLTTGETIVECGSCPALNVLEPLAGDAVAVQLYTKPLRPRPS